MRMVRDLLCLMCWWVKYAYIAGYLGYISPSDEHIDQFPVNMFTWSSRVCNLYCCCGYCDCWCSCRCGSTHENGYCDQCCRGLTCRWLQVHIAVTYNIKKTNITSETEILETPTRREVPNAGGYLKTISSCLWLSKRLSNDMSAAITKGDNAVCGWRAGKVAYMVRVGRNGHRRTEPPF